MKLKVRYDESVQTIDLDAEATEQLWVSLSLEGEDLTQKERERMIQDAFEEQFNRPDYNSWHKFDRHRGCSKAQPGKDDGEDDVDTSEPLMSEVADDRIFRRDEIERERCESYEDIRTKRDGRWTGHTVNGMIRNEKYTGDVIMQKTYTDDRFNRHINRGERTQYLARDHHEPIISHEAFEAANAIIDANGLEKGIHKDEDKYKNRYAMSGKIICGECGGTWKRVKLANHFGFSCNTHVRNKTACSMKTIAEEPVKAAFITLMNKLTYGRSLILIPYAEMLKSSQRSGNIDRLTELDEMLEKNTERRSQITQFFTKGLLDPAVYAEESDDLTEEADRLSEERDFLTTQMNGNWDQTEALDRLLKYTAKGTMITEFDPSLFTEHVDRIVVYERTEIGFAMKCGPMFRERI